MYLEIPATDFALNIFMIYGSFRTADPAIIRMPIPLEAVTAMHSLFEKKSNLLKKRSKQSSRKTNNLKFFGLD
jgi:hypothetical protein